MRATLRSAAALALAALAAAGPARADEPSREASRSAPDEAKRTRARALFVEAAALAKQARWTEALAAFEASARLVPHPGTDYNIAFCERALGRLTRARKRFAKALGQAGARDGELAADLAESARRYLAETDARIATVTVRLEPEAETIAVDGRPLEAEGAGGARPVLAAGTAELGPGQPPPATTFDVRVDPGPHLFVVGGPRGAREIAPASFEPGARAELALRLPRAAPPPAALPPAPPPPPPPEAPAPAGGFRLKAEAAAHLSYLWSDPYYMAELRVLAGGQTRGGLAFYGGLDGAFGSSDYGLQTSAMRAFAEMEGVLDRVRVGFDLESVLVAVRRATTHEHMSGLGNGLTIFGTYDVAPLGRGHGAYVGARLALEYLWFGGNGPVMVGPAVLAGVRY